MDYLSPAAALRALVQMPPSICHTHPVRPGGRFLNPIGLLSRRSEGRPSRAEAPPAVPGRRRGDVVSCLGIEAGVAAMLMTSSVVPLQKLSSNSS